MSESIRTKKARANRPAARSRKRSATARARTQAQQADRYALYEESVQNSEADLHLIRRVYRRHHGRAPETLREDFCGTAIFACDWVRGGPRQRAWGVDLDPVPLDYGRERHVAKLSAAQQARLGLIEGDVLDARTPPADVTVAFNFSYFLFRTRGELRRYFEVARKGLAEQGVFFLDAYGGGEAQKSCIEKRRFGRFRYVWDQHSFDPITHAVTNFIHFEFNDGSQWKRAFRYDWRLWSLPEIRELLLEAGFRKVEIYWEDADENGDGNGVFRLREHAPDDPAWICYIAALP